MLDLFSGAGGLSLGFKQSGFSIVGAVEIWEPAIQTYVRNHPDSKMIGGDIRDDVIKKQIRELHEKTPVNVIIGGFPCQSFSLSGNRNPLDARSQLYEEYLKVVAEIKPAMFLMENVKGLVSMKVIPPGLPDDDINRLGITLKKMQVFKDLRRYKAQRSLSIEESDYFALLEREMPSLKKEIKAALVPLLPVIEDSIKRLGYSVRYKVLNSSNYGSAQQRERVFIVAIRDDIKEEFAFPSPSVDRPMTSKESIGDLEDAAEFSLPNHEFTKHAPDFVKRISTIKPGKTIYKYSDAWWRLIPDQPSRTVKENHGGVFLHFSKDRTITPREMARLQDFPDDFVFEGGKSNVLKQIGNAVPVSLSRAMAVVFKKYLESRDGHA